MKLAGVNNFPEDAPFMDIRSFLWKAELCRYEFVSGETEEKHYSLFFKNEVLERQKQGKPVSILIVQAAIPVDGTQHYTLPTDPASYRERVIFPDQDANVGDGAALRLAFRKVVCWFQTFMLGCSAGVVDRATLNRFKSTRKLELELRTTKDAMNPVLTPVAINEEELDVSIKQKILASWIYPFIFSFNGNELNKIRRCRQCGLFLRGSA